MDSSRRRRDYRRQSTRKELRQILDELTEQDRSLLRVSTELLDTMAALAEAHDLLAKEQQVQTAASGGGATTTTGPVVGVTAGCGGSAGRVQRPPANGVSALNGDEVGMWTCTVHQGT